MVSLQNGHFSTFFYGNIGQKNVFCDILEPKNAFLGYKNNKFKTSRNWHFSKGLVHGFAPKMAIFPISFFFGDIGKENVFYDILERKNAFLRYIKQMLKKSKNWHFSKGLNPLLFVHKWLVLQLFFFGNIGQENVFYDILEQKNAFLGYKNKKFKKSKIDFFSKGLTHGFGPKVPIFPTFVFRQYTPRTCLLRYSRRIKPLSKL